MGVVSLHLLSVAGTLTPDTTSALVIWGLLGNVIDAFFIVSGFVLFLGVVRRGGRLGSLRDYTVGRVARLIPPYWVTLGVMLLLLAIVPVAGHGLPSVQNVAVHLVAMQWPASLLDPNVLVGFGINGALWMVSVIACFYLVFPLIARQYYRHPIAGLAVAAAIAIGWREAAVHLTGVFAAISIGDQPDWLIRLLAIDQLPGWAFSFGLGMTGAWAFTRLSAVDMERLRRAGDWNRPGRACRLPGLCLRLWERCVGHQWPHRGKHRAEHTSAGGGLHALPWTTDGSDRDRDQSGPRRRSSTDRPSDWPSSATPSI